jgi:DNA-binding transcriptional ArsR family regulator
VQAKGGVLDGDHADDVRRVAAAVSSSDLAALGRLRPQLALAAEHAARGYERGVYEGLLGVVDSVREAVEGSRGLAPQSAAIESGSLAARMLLEIARGVRGANADLADRLGTDQSQVSRAGRRLRELGLASRAREGRLNRWVLTPVGEHEAARLRAS